MLDMAHGVASLPASFWMELSLMFPIGFVVWITVHTIQRVQRRRDYHAWSGRPSRHW